MFNRLKTQLTEKTELVPVVTNTKPASNQSSYKTKSNQSDENHSSDDALSLKSNKINSDNLSDESNDNNNKFNLNRHVSIDQTFHPKTEAIIETNDDKKNLNNQNNHDNSIKAQLQQLNQTLLNQIDVLNNDLNEKLIENEELRTKIIKYCRKIDDYETEQRRLKEEIEDYKQALESFEIEIKSLKNDKDELIIKNAELSDKCNLLKLINNKQLNNHSENETHKSISHTNSIEKANETESNVSIQQTLEENKCLRDELSEKNKTIKNLQQRLNDMKKTLQKELKYQALPNEKQSTNSVPETNGESLEFTSNNSSSLQISPVTSNATFLGQHQQFKQINQISKKNLNLHTHIQSTAVLKKQLSSSDMSILHEDVNFKYLKHVVLKFLTSREYEALHLVKALSMLLNLNKDEEDIIKQTLEWKMSWFGTKPKLL